MRKPRTIPAARIEDALKTGLPGLQRCAEHLCYQYYLSTKLGTLLISPCDGAIRTRFAVVPAAAPRGASLNPYSGKWNFEGLADDRLVGRAIYWIERIAVQPSRRMNMAYSFGRGIPKNSILRKGTLIVGVPRQATQLPEPSSSPLPQDSKDDPMAAAANSLEDGLQKQIAERNRQSPRSASTTRKPSGNT